MPHLNILTKKESDAFDTPPIFSGDQRKRYFRMTSAIKNLSTQVKQLHSKVGLLIHLGYFKASGRFYSASNYYESDFLYICNQLRILPSEVQMDRYHRVLYHHHKALILDHCGYIAFSKSLSMFENQLLLFVSKHLPPRKIFLSISDWLRIQKIETPSYYQLVALITKTINEYEKKLYTKLENQITEQQKIALDNLIEHKDLFTFNDLKVPIQSEKVGKIRKSIEHFKVIEEKFNLILPLIKSLNLSAEVWRSYSDWAIRARNTQLRQLVTQGQRYLYLAAFIYHQFFIRQDFFVRILLNATNSISNKFKNYQKDLLYEQKELNRDYLQVKRQTEAYYKSRWEYTCKIVGDESLTEFEKLRMLSELVNKVDEKHQKRNDLLTDLEAKITSSNNVQLYYNYLEEHYIFLRNRVHQIIEHLDINEVDCEQEILTVISNYRKGNDKVFCENLILLLDEKHSKYFTLKSGTYRIKLCKSIFYLKVAEALKSGELHLKHSYKYRSIEQYLITKKQWDTEKQSLIKKAGLLHFSDVTAVLEKLEKKLDRQFERSNENISQEKNPYVKITNNQKVIVHTPGVDKPEMEPVADLFQSHGFTSIGHILADIEQVCNFSKELQHRNIKYTKNRPALEFFLAGIIGLGCNIGVHKMGYISKGINSNTLSNTVKWYFSEDNLRKANDKIVNFTRKLPIHDLFRHHKDEERQTSSDGQRYTMSVESLNASRSFKYKGKDKGVTVYGFVDESISTFYSTVITTAEREATYVLDGLIHNQQFGEDEKEWLHHTDTHGQSEVMFAAANLLGISLAPRIKNLKSKHLYAFQKPKVYKEKGYKLIPIQSINTEVIIQQWDNILRLIATIRLKETTASSIFQRLSSYAKQHPLYLAIKEMGKVFKSLYILKYYDELELRQITEKQLNKIERSHQFAHAIFFDNNREITQALKQDQDIAVCCRVIIQNTIVFWNCIRLSEILLKEKNEEEKRKIVQMIQNGTACTWRHINLQGIYEFDHINMSNFKTNIIQDILDMNIVTE